MNVIKILYLLTTMISILAMLPQIKKLHQTKKTDQFSVTTWSLWTFSGLISLIYAISLKSAPFLFAEISWFIFYLIMVSMIIYYKYKDDIPKIAIHITKKHQKNSKTLITSITFPNHDLKKLAK
jgi:uncharacterized protein with PQ loop repeat